MIGTGAVPVPDSPDGPADAVRDGVQASEPLQRQLRARALRLLARREYSREELRRKLGTQPARMRASGPAAAAGTDDASTVPAATLDTVLDSLARANWLSDTRCAELLVRGKASRMGIAGVARILSQKGIDGAAAAEALAPLRETERSRALELWRRRFGAAAPDARERARQYRFLQARGFDGATIAWVLKQAARGVIDADEPA